jgi:hypothetical protein
LVHDLRAAALAVPGRESQSIPDALLSELSGARDLNPCPHGPESHDFPSRSVDFCVLQFDSSDSRAFLVQILANLQPDFYTKYYMDLGRFVGSGTRDRGRRRAGLEQDDSGGDNRDHTRSASTISPQDSYGRFGV